MNLFRLFTKPASSRRKSSALLQFHPHVEGLESRVVPYTTSGNMWPNPQLVTISFMPDGTNLGSTTSNLFSTFNARFGSAATWQNVILKAAQVWAQQTNLNFAVIPDSGAPEGSGSYQQGDPTMGDIRIGGYAMNSSTLALAYMPPPVNNYSLAGDMTFNTAQTFNINGQAYDLFTVAVHEFGHALGMLGSNTLSADMYESYTGTKVGLTSDDISGIRNAYSNSNPRSPDVFGNLNNSFSNAANVNSYIDPTSLTAQVNTLDIATAGQKEYYTVTAPSGTGSTVTISVQSQGLSLLAPKVYVYAADQITLLGSASGYGKYGTTLTLNLASKISAGQQFYIEVTGADTTSFGTGNYALTMSFAGNPLPTVSPPSVQVENGFPLSGGGGQALAQAPPYRVAAPAAASAQVALQSPQAVAMDAQGNYVVTWASNNGSHWDIDAQRFDPTGMPQGKPFQVNTYTQGDTEYPAVAMDATGGFVITWSANGEDGSGWGVYAQRFDAAGNPLGSEFQVNTITTNDQLYPSAAMDAAGNFVITWSSDNQYPQTQSSGGLLGGLLGVVGGLLGGGSQPIWTIYAQRYDAAGAAQGGQFQVNDATQTNAEYSTAAMDAAGNFVVTWSGQNSNGVWNAYAQRYDATGTGQGGNFQVNSLNTGDQMNPSVAMDTAGDFVITWSRHGGNGWDVVAQRYNAAGATQGGEFEVSTTSASSQENAAVAMNGTGDFLITWATNATSKFRSGWYVLARQYSSDGAAEGSAFPVSVTGGNQTLPSVARDHEGHIVAVWNDSTSSGDGVFAQRYVIGGDALSVPDDGKDGASANDTTAGQEAGSLPILPTPGPTFTPAFSNSSPQEEKPAEFARPEPVAVPSSAGQPETHHHIHAHRRLAQQALDAWFASTDGMDAPGA